MFAVDTGSIRHKKDSKAIVTTILRRPEPVPSDEPAKMRDETDALAKFKVERGLGAALDSYYQPFGSNIYSNLNMIVRAARTYVGAKR